jgi:hypothetical protein
MRYMVEFEYAGRRTVSQRDAETPHDAAAQAALGFHRSWWVEDKPYRVADSSHSFSVREGPRSIATARVLLPMRANVEA